MFGLRSRNSKERPRFRHKQTKIANEKMERKPSLRCTLLLLRKWNRIPSADCQICSLSSFYPMTSMCGGPPLPLSPVRDPLLQSVFSLGLSFHHTFRALPKVGKTSSPSPPSSADLCIYQSAHPFIPAKMNASHRSLLSAAADAEESSPLESQSEEEALLLSSLCLSQSRTSLPPSVITIKSQSPKCLVHATNTDAGEAADNYTHTLSMMKSTDQGK